MSDSCTEKTDNEDTGYTMPCYINKIKSLSLDVSGGCSSDGGEIEIELKEKPQEQECQVVSSLNSDDLITITRNGKCAKITVDNFINSMGCKECL